VSGDGGRCSEERAGRKESGEREGELEQEPDEERRLENGQQERVLMERALGVLLEREAEGWREGEEPERRTLRGAGAREDAPGEADEYESGAEGPEERRIEVAVARLFEQVLAALVVRLRDAVGERVRCEGAGGGQPERQEPGEAIVRSRHARSVRGPA
jgi:hypothetical protein